MNKVPEVAIYSVNPSHSYQGFTKLHVQVVNVQKFARARLSEQVEPLILLLNPALLASHHAPQNDPLPDQVLVRIDL